ncbi:Methyltransferase domain containing protein [uncultured Caudovirales phage]|uniref:Methyltransferase domain containing protein n=1 Tax=uncultured Caudovirales phage TaxID=2100421 RepID=A0A6J5ME48_9CAUD|nr:Methyltransferase domain containing protein [uncultured Caudovirales phage]
MVMRWDIINSLIRHFDYKSYLEVGTQDPNSNFNKIQTDYKESIDPNPQGPVTFVGTSDEYFESIKDSNKFFDIIFIDGLHHSDQVLKDVQNSLKHLSKNGTIVCHDCLPTSQKMQERYDHGGEWTGDVWKAIAELRVTNKNLEIKVVNTDYGCGILRPGNNELYQPWDNYKTYEYFEMFKEEMLNVISVNEFEKWINSL